MMTLLFGGIVAVVAGLVIRILQRNRGWPVASPFAALVGAVVLLTHVFFLMSRYSGSIRWMERPFVLYLRRFTSFSDRVVVRFLLGALPTGVPLVMLIPARGGPRDWDPVMVGFSGFRFRRPIASMPISLESTNERWEQEVRRLVDRAKCVVLDATEQTDAIKRELEILSETNAWDKVIILSDDTVKNETGLPERSHHVRYRKSLRASVPKAIVQLALFALLCVGMKQYPHYYPQTMVWSLLLMFPAMLLPSLTRASSREIKLRLQERLNRASRTPS